VFCVVACLARWSRPPVSGSHFHRCSFDRVGDRASTAYAGDPVLIPFQTYRVTYEPWMAFEQRVFLTFSSGSRILDGPGSYAKASNSRFQPFDFGQAMLRYNERQLSRGCLGPISSLLRERIHVTVATRPIAHLPGCYACRRCAVSMSRRSCALCRRSTPSDLHALRPHHVGALQRAAFKRALVDLTGKVEAFPPRG